MQKYVAAEIFGLKLAPPRTTGYDALRGTERIQIKGRAYGKDAKPGQRMSRIKLDASCDTVLLVLLDNATLEPREMWEAPFGAVAACLGRPGSKAPARGALAVSAFKRIARLVWPKPDETEPATSARVGDQNRHGQILIETTDQSSPNHPFAKVWILRCPKHGTYKANSCDFHIRRCPEEGGQPASRLPIGPAYAAPTTSGTASPSVWLPPSGGRLPAFQPLTVITLFRQGSSRCCVVRRRLSPKRLFLTRSSMSSNAVS